VGQAAAAWLQLVISTTTGPLTRGTAACRPSRLQLLQPGRMTVFSTAAEMLLEGIKVRQSSS
jgi:hypothetical protein